MALTNFPNGITSFGVPVLGSIGGATFTGNYYFVDPVNGADGNEGSVELPLKTLYRALQLCTAGNNDVVVLIGDGTSAGSARLSVALAQSIDSTATTGTLTWNKDATHLVGVCSPTRVGQRARIAPPTGTYTAATFNSLAFINVTASGCYFANLSVFCGFSTGIDGMIAWTDSGNRNAYDNVNIQGIADAASAAGADSRTLKLTGGGERTFTNCVFGTSTVSRGAANATIEFASGTARNAFVGCTMDFQTSAATPVGIKAGAAASMDRYQLFQDCTFINNVGSTSTQMDGLATLAASSGGQIVMKNATMVGITEFGTDATSRGQIYVDGGAPTAGTTGMGLGLNDPSPMPNGVGPLGRIYVWDTVPAAAAANNIAASQTPTGANTLSLTAGAGVTAVRKNDFLTVYQLDCPRAVSVTQAGAGTQRNFTVSGYDIYDQPMTEVITSTVGATVNGKKAFSQVESVSVSGATTTACTVGTTDVIGIPVRVTNAGYVASVKWDNTLADDAGTFVAAVTTTATSTSGDVRGTYDPSSACDGAKRLVMGILLPAIAVGPNATRIGALGVTQA